MTRHDDVPGLHVEAVSVVFGGVAALQRVSFEVVPGSIHALIGPNGAGKSTCFNVISGVQRPASGRVRFGADVLTDLAPHRIAALGVTRVFQHPALSAAESVMDNMMLGRDVGATGGFLSAGLRLARERRQETQAETCVREIAFLLGLEAVLDVPAGALPYGVQKLVEIGRALCARPLLLLADEPVAGMTPGEADAVAATILDIRARLGISVLVVEHNMPLVMGIADLVTVLDFGNVIAEGPPAAVRADVDVVRAYLGVPAGSVAPAPRPSGVKTR